MINLWILISCTYVGGRERNKNVENIVVLTVAMAENTERKLCILIIYQRLSWEYTTLKDRWYVFHHAYDVVTTLRTTQDLEPWRTLNHLIIFSFFSVTQNPLCLLILGMRHFAWNLLGCYTLPVHATQRLVTFILDLTDHSQLERERCGLKLVANKLWAVRFRTACSNMVVNLLAGYRIYHCN